ncbi:NAD(P)H-dependent oxidoreductase [bacterium]|nr:NAD(P)H-dependent oxidoreductase [bacterium]
MKPILVIQASPQGEQSLSRKITGEFLSQYALRFGKKTLTERDLTKDTLPHISGEFVSAMFVPPANRTPDMIKTLDQGNQLVDELIAHDEIVISTPMYNNTVPSSLKAWIDHIVLPGRTFNFGPNGIKGLLEGKVLYFICATGDTYSTGPRKHEDFLTPYIKHIMGLIGIKDVRPIYVEGVVRDREAALSNARKHIESALNG